MAKKRKHWIAWIEMGTWPCYVGFTISQKALDKETLRLTGKRDAVVGPAGGGGRLHAYERSGEMPCYLITIRLKPGVTLAQKVGMIAHEVAHLAQNLWREIGEESPGNEAEAYLIQTVTQCCVQALEKMEAARG